MPTLESLKAEHPEWCWKCGREHQSDGHYLVCTDSPVISALTTKCLEDEATIREKDARIAELEEVLSIASRVAGINFLKYQADLSAEQAAHAATKEELRKADEVIRQQARELGAKLEPIEGCVLEAVHTGEGWSLQVGYPDGHELSGEAVALLAWPSSWPETMTAKQLGRFGFEVV